MVRAPARAAKRTAFDWRAFPPRVALANYYPFAPGEVVGKHYSESNLILLVMHGQGQIQVGAVWFELQAGQVVHVPWAAPILYRASHTEPFVLIGIHLDYRSWSAPPVPRPRHTPCEAGFDLARGSPAPRAQPFEDAFSFNPAPDSPVFDLATLITSAFEHGIKDGPQREREATLRGLALAFLEEFTLAQSPRSTASERERGSATALQTRVVQNIASYMEHTLSKPLRRPELARRAGLSQSALAEAFRAVTGRGPIDYLIDLRILRAKRLLRSGRARIGEIAAEVGIPDVYHFSKIFKKRAGCSPLEFRRRLHISAVRP